MCKIFFFISKEALLRILTLVVVVLSLVVAIGSLAFAEEAANSPTVHLSESKLRAIWTHKPIDIEDPTTGLVQAAADDLHNRRRLREIYRKYVFDQDDTSKALQAAAAQMKKEREDIKDVEIYRSFLVVQFKDGCREPIRETQAATTGFLDFTKFGKKKDKK